MVTPQALGSRSQGHHRRPHRQRSQSIEPSQRTVRTTSNEQTTFRPGDQIWYVVTINIENGPAKATVEWRVTGPREIYNYASNQTDINTGYQAPYAPTAVPQDAPPGTYTLTAYVTFNGSTTIRTGTFSVSPRAENPPPPPVPEPAPTPSGVPPPPLLTPQHCEQLINLVKTANNEKKAVSCTIYIGRNAYELVLWLNQVGLAYGKGIPDLPLPSGNTPVYTGQCHLIDWQELTVFKIISWPISDPLLGVPDPSHLR